MQNLIAWQCVLAESLNQGYEIPIMPVRIRFSPHTIAVYNPRLEKRAFPSGQECSIGMTAGKTANASLAQLVEQIICND